VEALLRRFRPPARFIKGGVPLRASVTGNGLLASQVRPTGDSNSSSGVGSEETFQFDVAFLADAPVGTSGTVTAHVGVDLAVSVAFGTVAGPATSVTAALITVGGTLQVA